MQSKVTEEVSRSERLRRRKRKRCELIEQEQQQCDEKTDELLKSSVLTSSDHSSTSQMSESATAKRTFEERRVIEHISNVDTLTMRKKCVRLPEFDERFRFHIKKRIGRGTFATVHLCDLYVDTSMDHSDEDKDPDHLGSKKKNDKEGSEEEEKRDSSSHNNDNDISDDPPPPQTRRIGSWKGPISAAVKRLVSMPNLRKQNLFRQFCSELEILKQCGYHPNIPSLYCAGFDINNGRLSYAMSYLKGEQPFDRYYQCMSELECRNYLWHLLDALSHLHRNGFIHRDIKPSNFLCDFGMNSENKNENEKDDHSKHWHYMLVDFGLSEHISVVDTHSAYAPSRRAGTAGFRAPEALLGCAHCQGFTIDSWSVGVILLTIVVGRFYPFFHAASDDQGLLEICRFFGQRRVMDQLNRHCDGPRSQGPWLRFEGVIDNRPLSEHLSDHCQFGRVFCDYCHDHSVPQLQKNEIYDQWQVSDFVKRFVLPTDKRQFSDSCYDLLGRLLCINPSQRCLCEDALKHPWFEEEL